MSQADSHRRGIRSFVVRGGRITDAQERALSELWPRYGIDFTPAPLDFDAVFKRRAPRVVEIGFGTGENLVALATARPERDHLGIEVHRPGVGRLLLAIEKLGLANVRAICHDAVEVLDHQIPAASLDEVLILFPDPWHKKRHHKRRLIQPPFAALVANRLKAGGVLRLATDWQPYAEQMLEVLTACPELENLSGDGSFIARSHERLPTRFEKRGERLGHGVWDLAFRRLQATG
ncbi:MAG: tRNA (guanosine(46)-N7)-methyltransferase TrmB [Steroidobacteraceae bacterium]